MEWWEQKVPEERQLRVEGLQEGAGGDGEDRPNIVADKEFS